MRILLPFLLATAAAAELVYSPITITATHQGLEALKGETWGKRVNGIALYEIGVCSDSAQPVRIQTAHVRMLLSQHVRLMAPAYGNVALERARARFPMFLIGQLPSVVPLVSWGMERAGAPDAASVSAALAGALITGIRSARTPPPVQINDPVTVLADPCVTYPAVAQWTGVRRHEMKTVIHWRKD